MSDLYSILQLSKNATEHDIKKAYKKLAQKHHPDKGGDEEKFKEIQHAYEILKNSEKRQIYDQFGEEGLENNGSDMNNFNMDPFNMFFNMQNNMRRNMIRKCEPVVVHINVTLEDLYNKKTIHKNININSICKDCHGNGTKDGTPLSKCSYCHGKGFQIQIRQLGPGMIQQMQSLCRNCHGKGHIVDPHDKCVICQGEKIIKKEITFNITVDPSIENGKQILYQDKGNEYPEHQKGDIVFIFVEKENDIFKRVNGNDLYMKKKIKLLDALTGFKIEITQLDKRKLHTIIDTVVEPTMEKVIIGEGMVRNKSNLIIGFEIEFPSELVIKKNKLAKLLKN